jgi:pimeloyl-ACP methyl ester carboxylesterase
MNEIEQPQDRYIKIGDVNSRYWQVGDVGSPVILLHGGGGYIELWRHNILALAKHHRVYAFDMVGAGRADKPDNVDYTFDYMARFVRDFMQALAIPRASLIGASAGGAVTLSVMLQFPELVEKAILVGSAGLGKEVSWLLKLPTLPLVGELLGSPSRSSLKMLCQHAVYNRQIMTDEMVEEFYQMAILPGASASMLNLGRANFNLWGQFDRFSDRLATIDTPTLIIWGRQDPMVPLAQGQNAARIMPNARLEIIEECGHWSPIEHPDLFNRLGLEFLA